MSLQIGQYIRHALESHEALQQEVRGSVFPVLAPMDGSTEPPYIVFASNGMTEEGSKDGPTADTVEEEILVFGSTLDEMERVAQLVREAMAEGWPLWNSLDGTPFRVAEQTMKAGGEDYDLQHGGFYTPLLYTIETEPTKKITL